MNYHHLQVNIVKSAILLTDVQDVVQHLRTYEEKVKANLQKTERRLLVHDIFEGQRHSHQFQVYGRGLDNRVS